VSEEDPQNEGFEAMLRRIAEQVSRSVEHLDELDIEQLARAVGVDAERARELMDGAGEWLSQADGLANEFAQRLAGLVGSVADGPKPSSAGAPHPLDQPTPGQGLALSAIDSGRWTIEPGSHEIVADGDGPAPADALGLVGELRVRDWINAQGELTLVGRNALKRWMDPPETAQ
jgi:hypothetical protein